MEMETKQMTAEAARAGQVTEVTTGAAQEETAAVTQLGQQVKTLEERLERMSARLAPEARVRVGRPVAETKGLADALLTSGAWQERTGAQMRETVLPVDAVAALGLGEAKTLMSTTAGFSPEVLRSGVVVPSVTRVPTILDFLPIVPTTQNAFKFMQEVLLESPAAGRLEGQPGGEATVEYEEQTVPIRRIGVTLPVTEEQLEDEPGVRALVEQRMATLLRVALDAEAVAGDGLDGSLRGLLSLTGTQTQAKGSDPIIDAFAKAMTKVRTTGGASPNLILMNPNDHLKLILTRTTDGAYVMGHPSDEMSRRLLGVSIALSETLPAGTALVLDTNYFPLVMREGISVAVSDSHGENFTSHILMVRAHLRAAIASYRDAALCRVTGL